MLHGLWAALHVAFGVLALLTLAAFFWRLFSGRVSASDTPRRYWWMGPGHEWMGLGYWMGLGRERSHGSSSRSSGGPSVGDLNQSKPPEMADHRGPPPTKPNGIVP
jgi:hypothetical protein